MDPRESSLASLERQDALGDCVIAVFQAEFM